ncbi:beta-ketoacyl synthase N-terminal-like domain-containing protein [Nannocystis radixulma]|uniref:Beta-ketoacyl synthase N-terminal-like domain-containing protein n=1 Tax=Nannocystis radixulma TaxID=2995305 RepID=A0ABT5BSB9_9BACT|nr:beta-ketoacyl synthase N-terminal-like domain-containing protein [Nannocystis radixulma]MDC0675877.1 beta-ketoacyl synthase N-terminal-like domain-containing protein [Nannocystis radixulma]
MSEAAAVVLSVGLACPLGLRARPALAALRAGIRRFHERDDVFDLAGEPARACYLQSLDPNLSSGERAGFFAQHAVRDMLYSVAQTQVGRVSVYLAGAEPGRAASGAGSAEAVARVVARMLDSHSRWEIATAMPRFGQGAAGTFWALHSATQAIAHGETELALVGGADSLVDPSSLQSWAASNRLLGRSNGDGAIPGEGAAFVLLGPSRVDLARYGLARVHAVATAEQAAFAAYAPATGEGLTAVFRALQQQLDGRTDEIIVAQPPCVKWSREVSFASLRCAALMPEPFRHTWLGAALGDTGAASGALALVHAVAALQPWWRRAGRETCRRTLAAGMSEEGWVGAGLLASVREEAAT